MANGDSSIATLLRQRQLMQQMNQTTGQGTQADILNPNLRAFDDTGGGTETTGTGVQQRRGGGLILSALTGIPPRGQRGQNAQADAMNRSPTGGIPGISQIEQAKQRMASGIQGLATGQGLGGFRTPPTIQPGSVYQPPANPPVLQNRTPAGQPTPGPGQMLTTDADGNVIVAPRPTAAPTLQPQPRQYNPFLGQ